MEKKKQHLIPNCYLKAWCDPSTPDGQEPYIWIHPAGGGEPKRKSPRKSFTETDRYTIESGSGDRDLRVEDTLANIETRFVRIREQLEAVHQIPADDHFLLCAFVAAMCSRTKRAGDQLTKVWDKVRSQASRLAHAQGRKLKSLQLDDLVHNASPRWVEATLSVLTPMLFQMRAGIYYAESRDAFITSDNPCVWNDTDSLRRPPALRNPALNYPNIQIILPLSPKSVLLLTHDARYAGYFRADEQFINEINRLTRFFSHEYFVTQDGRTNSIWFEQRDLPMDAWENTAEGKSSMALGEKYREMEEKSRAERATTEPDPS